MPHPPSTSKARIEMLSAAHATDDHLVEVVIDLVNRVYATAEAGLWIDGATRTTIAEIRQMIAAEEIAVACVDEQVVGSVRIQQLDDDTGEFGMLVADPDRRGEGIGRDLVLFAEDLARRRGSSTMQLEVLLPRGWSHPTKEFLRAWYGRLGYTPVRAGSIDEAYPHLAPLLATPCDYVVYHKPLPRAQPSIPP
jgi:GNAT superfamily N-acetyltransferase